LLLATLAPFASLLAALLRSRIAVRLAMAVSGGVTAWLWFALPTVACAFATLPLLRLLILALTAIGFAGLLPVSIRLSHAAIGLLTFVGLNILLTSIAVLWLLLALLPLAALALRLLAVVRLTLLFVLLTLLAVVLLSAVLRIAALFTFVLRIAALLRFAFARLAALCRIALRDSIWWRLVGRVWRDDAKRLLGGLADVGRRRSIVGRHNPILHLVSSL
jgi:hypothetical protein